MSVSWAAFLRLQPRQKMYAIVRDIIKPPTTEPVMIAFQGTNLIHGAGMSDCVDDATPELGEFRTGEYVVWMWEV